MRQGQLLNWQEGNLYMMKLATESGSHVTALYRPGKWVLQTGPSRLWSVQTPNSEIYAYLNTLKCTQFKKQN